MAVGEEIPEVVREAERKASPGRAIRLPVYGLASAAAGVSLALKPDSAVQIGIDVAVLAAALVLLYQELVCDSLPNTYKHLQISPQDEQDYLSDDLLEMYYSE